MSTYGTAETLSGSVRFHLLNGMFFWIALLPDCGHGREIDLREVPGAIEDQAAHMRAVHSFVNRGDWAGFTEFIAERLDGRDIAAAVERGMPHTCEGVH